MAGYKILILNRQIATSKVENAFVFEAPVESWLKSSSNGFPQKLIFLRFWHVTWRMPFWNCSYIEQNVSLSTRLLRSISISSASSWMSSFCTSGFNLREECFISSITCKNPKNVSFHLHFFRAAIKMKFIIKCLSQLHGWSALLRANYCFVGIFCIHLCQIIFEAVK